MVPIDVIVLSQCYDSKRSDDYCSVGENQETAKLKAFSYDFTLH